ncbi:hypothetical protein [Tabrizicola soli]|uniref:Tip attachment protein J domain-containing protein n=1 Tax=Tabrizicola soli TaxID=2185115 RepID=A0ABV7DZH7_9RHOB|nr:hypothetical protein [Tabrizicola soli]
MSQRYLAIVGDTEAWNPAVHQRHDLGPFDVTFNHRESELATARITVTNPQASLSSLDGRRVLISTKGRLLFDGILTGVPRGLVDQKLTLEAVSRPADPAVLDAQLAVLAEGAKVAPYWDPLFIPDGRDDDWAELLAGRSEVLAHSRIQGVPSLCDALGGATNMEIQPLNGSVSYSLESNVATKYGVKLTAKWKQLAAMRFDDGGQFWNLSSMTPDGLIESFPKEGSTLSDGFTVVRSTIEKAETPEDGYAVVWAVTDEELDPEWTFEGTQATTLMRYEIDAHIEVEYRWEVARTETATMSVQSRAQAGVIGQSEEWEEMELRDLVERDRRAPWSPNTTYEVDDEVVDGRNAYRCRTEHISGRTRTAAEWSLLGPSSYIATRQYVSFFKSARGRAAVEHALERMKARARLAARSVRISFEAPMPARPWLVTHDMTISLESPKLPGGFATGRLVEYSLSWANGRASFSGTIACAAGLGDIAAPTIGTAEGSTPESIGRMDVFVDNDGRAQLEWFEENVPEGSVTEGSLDVPETVIQIHTYPAAATSFEQAVSFPIYGAIGIPTQVQT